MKINSQIINKVAVFCGLAIGALAISALAQTTWTPPHGSPTDCPSGYPGCDAPLNVGASAQQKLGSLTLNFNNLSSTGLKVLGNIQMVDGNQAGGKVLVADNSGTGSWKSLNCDSGYALQGIDTSGNPTCVPVTISTPTSTPPTPPTPPSCVGTVPLVISTENTTGKNVGYGQFRIFNTDDGSQIQGYKNGGQSSATFSYNIPCNANINIDWKVDAQNDWALKNASNGDAITPCDSYIRNSGVATCYINNMTSKRTEHLYYYATY